jgi:hypothetical protein
LLEELVEHPSCDLLVLVRHLVLRSGWGFATTLDIESLDIKCFW